MYGFAAYASLYLQTLPDKFVDKLKDYVDYYPVCAELEIGLGVPRDPVRLVQEDGQTVLYRQAGFAFPANTCGDDRFCAAISTALPPSMV